MLDLKSKSFYVALLTMASAVKLFLAVWFKIELSSEQIDASVNLLACLIVFGAMPVNRFFVKRRKKKEAEEKRREQNVKDELSR